MPLNLDQITYEDHVRSQCGRSICVVAEDFTISSNVGSLFRISDALGVEKIYLSGSSPTPPNRKIKQASRAADRHVPFAYERDALAIIEKRKAEGYLIVALERTVESRSIREHDIQEQKICLILGAERKGIRDALLLASDVVLHIPMCGVNSSMNVSDACAIALYELSSFETKRPNE